MNESKQRIAEYKKLLPDLKERVVAVALLLVISFTMVITTSFAWVVLSRSPEVTGVSTTVASNGNLEIALVAPDGSLPRESAVGDSAAAEGQSILNANLTWGNMINLSDPSYGLDNLVLRPAQLNKAALLTNPLYGAEYGDDGRIIKLNSNFAYTKWLPAEYDDEGRLSKPARFGVIDEYGVRAISSTKIEAVGANITYYRMVGEASDANLMAVAQYSSLSKNSGQMQSLATMMGLYMTARMNPDEPSLNNPDCTVADIQNLAAMYEGFLEAFELEAEAMAKLLNLRAFLKHGEGNYTPYTGDMMFTITNSELKATLDVEITKLTEFQKDYKTVTTDVAVLQELIESGSGLKWKDVGPSNISLNDIVNHLVNVGACTIGADNTPISSIGASNAMNYLSGTQEARITNGILYRFEERVGGYIEVKNLGISATVKRMGLTIPATVKANVQTTAPRDYFLFNNDLEAVKATNTGEYQGGEAVAEDTFGLAIDFWIRTNAQAHYLVLEGNVLTETKTVRAKGKDANGNEVELFAITRSVEDPDSGETVSVTYTLYEGEVVVPDENGNETTVKAWFDYDTYGVIELEEGENPTPKMEEIEVVIGYEGENRVWDRDNEANKLNLTVNSTTQGSGSCYVYYADTPEDQARSLELLKAMKVAFVGADGKIMASAYMDTERFYAANGKVIVPLALDSSESINLGEDREGNMLYGITALERNVATRVTAIVYLDGQHLSNEDVLAAASIQGQLNIQFGTYADDLQNMESEKLKGQELTVSASVNKTQMDYDTAQSAADLTSTVTVNVQGSQPNTVTAFFLRAINSTQGSREETMTFTKQGDGTWKADYTFTAPGNYILRSVRLDGVEYDLTERPEILVKGFTVKSLTCNEADENRHVTVMTASGSHTVNLSLAFASDDVTKMPGKVQGRFLRDIDGSAVNIDFAYNPASTTWTGNATFLTSGDYTLQYLILDGEYVELVPEQRQTATVYLGMRVTVYTTSPHKFLYAPSEMTDNQKILAMQVKIMDNAGNEMPGLNGVKLTYGMKGSGAKTMDANLTWNGTYYVGEFPMVDYTAPDGTTIEKVGGPGIWQFGNVTVGTDVITNATDSPTFTVLSPEPPTYHTHRTPTYQYAPNNNAIVNVHIANSEAAVVWAYIVKAGEAEGVWVKGSLGTTYEYSAYEGATPVSVTEWRFTVPKDTNGYQDGNWQLTALKLWDVFAADGTPYTEESPLEIDVSDKSIVSKVVSQVVVKFEENRSQNFGKDANGTVTGAFMQSHTISGLKVNVTDFAGDALVDDKGNLLVTGIELTFTHNGDSATYGGYTSTALEIAPAITVFLTPDSTDNTKFVQTAYKLNDGSDKVTSATAPILYAGSYKTTMIVFMTVSSNSTETKYEGAQDTQTTKKLPANTPVFTVSSVKPRAKITGVNTGTSTSINTKLTWETNRLGTPTFTASESKKNSFSDYAATLYASATVDNGGSWGVGNRHGFFAEPKLSISVSGAADGFTVSMTLPAGASPAIEFSRTGNGAIEKEIGKVSTVKSFGAGSRHYLEGYAGHGTVKIETMTLTKDGVTYTVTLDNPLVITNPSSVDQLS